MSRNSTATAGTDLPAALADADEACREVERRIEEYGEQQVEAVADAYDRATSLLDRYEGRATGTGDFEAFVRFQEEFATLVEELPDDLPGHEAFESADDRFDKRRLNERDFEKGRADLEPAAEIAGLLDERETVVSEYHEVRHEVKAALREVREEISERERLLELSDADLDAPVEEIRDPIETYNDAVSGAFDEFRSEASAREVLDFVAATDDYPLVEFRSPPDPLREYVENREAGTETVSDLLEYARYSNSKLDHYVDDPAALKRAVATNETYLERLDADPLQLDWPPESADELRWRIEELVSAVGRFADDEVVAHLREVADLVRDEERFERLRTVAEAEAELSESEREKIASGEVESELADLRERRERLESALEEYPER